MLRNLNLILRILSGRTTYPGLRDEWKETRLRNEGQQSGFCECQIAGRRSCRTQGKFRKLDMAEMHYSQKQESGKQPNVHQLDRE